MKEIIVAILIFLILLPTVSALPTPTLTFIPEKISANSNFIAIADPGILTKSIRINWAVFGTSALGSFPYIGNKWYCYFSNIDSTSTCGPTPFSLSTEDFGVPYTVEVKSIKNDTETANLTKEVEVGGIILTSELVVSNSIVEMTIWPDTYVDTVSYKVYEADSITEVAGKNGNMQYYTPIRGYISNITLDPGSYYIAFSATSLDDFGGTIEKVSVTSTTDPEDPSEPKTNYSLEIEKVKLNIVLTEGEKFEQSNFQITNKGSETVSGLSVSIPKELSNYLSISLGNNSIDPGDSIYFTVKLDNVNAGLDINTKLSIMSNSIVVGEIPLNIGVTFLGNCSGNGKTVPPSTVVSNVLSTNPSSWTGSFLMTDEVSETFIITNNGDEYLKNFSYSTAGSIGSVIDEVKLPSSLSSGSSDSIEISLLPYYSGTYIGTLIIESNKASVGLSIATSFFDDISGDIDKANEDLNSFISELSASTLTKLSDTIDDISRILNNSRSELEDENYALAKKYLDEATAKLEIASDITGLFKNGNGVDPNPTPNGGGEVPLGLIGVLILIIIIAVGVWFYFTKFKKKSLEQELEEEY